MYSGENALNEYKTSSEDWWKYNWSTGVRQIGVSCPIALLHSCSLHLLLTWPVRFSLFFITRHQADAQFYRRSKFLTTSRYVCMYVLPFHLASLPLAHIIFIYTTTGWSVSFQLAWNQHHQIKIPKLCIWMVSNWGSNIVLRSGDPVPPLTVIHLSLLHLNRLMGYVPHRTHQNTEDDQTECKRTQSSAFFSLIILLHRSLIPCTPAPCASTGCCIAW